MDVQRTCSSDDDDDVPALPLDTLAILQEFYQEQAERQGFTLEANGGKITQGEIDVEEDWVSEPNQMNVSAFDVLEIRTFINTLFTYISNHMYLLTY